MDKQLLDALDNVAMALQQIADSLGQNKNTTTPSAKALQSGDFSDGLIKISEGIEMLKEDNKTIIDNQQTIIKLQKEQGSPTSKVFEGAGQQKSMLKDGVSVILLVAGAVAAIGLAFQLVGNVDWKSVIALSISLPLIAYAFEKIAVMKDLTATNMATLFGVSVMMATSIAVSSWILQGVVPVGPFQLLTAILIAGVFSVIATSMNELMVGATIYDKSGVSPGTVLAMFGAVSAGIVASSWAMNLIVPISIAQGLTAILIAGTFAIISSNMVKMMAGIAVYDKANIDGKKVILALVGVAGAITASSWIMNMIVPVSFAQGLTAIMISATFAIISHSMEKLMAGVAIFDKFNISPVKLSLSLLAIATSITAASWIMNMIVPLSLNQALTSIVIAGIFAGISYFFDKIAVGMLIIDKTIGFGKLFVLPLFFTAVSTAITLSSIIMSGIIPMTFSQLLTVVGVGVALSVVTPLLGMSMVVASRIGTISDYIKGGASVIVVASTIALSSLILGLGNYGNYPDVSWSAGVGLSILSFGVSTMALGGIMMATGGLGVGALVAGAASVLVLALTIVGVSHILSLGNYADNAYPGMSWVGGVGLTLVAFGAFTVAMSIMGGAVMFGSATVLAIAGTIYGVSLLLSRGEYGKFPSSDWMVGAGLTLLKFGGLLTVFGMGSILVGPLMAVGMASMIAMAGTIYTVSNLLSKGDYKKFPSSDWITGVSTTLTSFVSAFKEIDLLDVIASELLDFVGLGIPDIAEGILKIDEIFSRGRFMVYPNEYYMLGVRRAIFGYVDMVKELKRVGIPKLSGGFDIILNQADTLMNLADSLDSLGDSMYRFSNSIDSLDLEKMQAIRSLSSSVVMLSLMDPDQFEMMMSKLESKSEVFSQLAVDIEQKRRESGVAVTVAGPEKTVNNMADIGQKLDNVTALLADISSVVGSSGTLKNYLMSIREKQIDDNVRSDIRSKVIVEHLGVSVSGINIYTFYYKFDKNQLYQGIIAQELLGTMYEDALNLDDNGLYSVNYSKIDVDFKKV
jgi:hypothetical protein